MVISTVRSILIVVGTAAYLGVAILGRGGFEAFFSQSALVVLAFALFGLSGAALFAGGNLSPGVREDRGNRWVLIVFALIGLLGAYLPAYTDREEFWTFDGDGIRWLGVALFTAGGALNLASICARSPIQRPCGHSTRPHRGGRPGPACRPRVGHRG